MRKRRQKKNRQKGGNAREKRNEKLQRMRRGRN